MLRTLVIVRHAMPENISASGLDHDRKLTDLGVTQAKQAASFIAELNLKNPKLLTSDASRALETAQAIGVAVNSDLYSTGRLYTSSPRQIIEEISRVDPSKSSVVIVGHNPTFSELTSELSSEMHRLTQGQCMVLTCELDDWALVNTVDWQIQNIFIPS